MYDTDEMTAELRERLASGQVPPAPPLDTITARGRARRRHRLLAVAGLSVAGAAAATAVGLNLNGDSPAARTPAANHQTSARHDPGSTGRRVPPAKIRTVAYTLVRHTDGTVTLTIDPTELFDPGALQSDLQQDGIPAQVTTGKICSSDPAPGPVSQVVVWHPRAAPGGNDTITIDPSAMPAGSELSFGTVGLEGNVEAAEFTLIDPNAFTCSPTPLNDAPPRVDHGGVFRIRPTN